VRLGVMVSRWCVSALMVAGAMAQAQSALRVDKIDPPNWYAGMPKPMLLVRGEGLKGATVRLSDRGLRVEKVVPSANGHWLQIWLGSSPAKAETVTLTVVRGKEMAKASYTFQARRKAGDGIAGFNAKDVMYLIMQDRFADGDHTNDGLHADAAFDSADAKAERAKVRGWHGGDLRGVDQHLGYLQKMGVTAVWLTPVYQNHEDDSYHGYGATDMFAVDEHYGTLSDLQSLTKALHARGMKLVLDTVPNHVGPKHPWVKDEPAPNWFHGTAEHHIAGETKFDELMSPHAPRAAVKSTLDGWFVDLLPDMDTEDPAVERYLVQNAEWWIEETGADALRIDTFPYVNREFWNGYLGELERLYPKLTEVGEVSWPTVPFVSSYAGGVTRTGVDTKLYTPFDYPSYFAIYDVFTKGAPMTKLTDVLAQDALYPHAERLPVFFGNHDQPRLREHATEGMERLAYGYVMTARGMPQLYSGDEIAMKGDGDPDNRRDFPGGFGETKNDAFTEGGRTPEQQRMYAWVSELAKARREHVALACGGEQVLHSDAEWVVTVRDDEHAAVADCAIGDRERVLVALHRGKAAERVEVPLAETWAAGCKVGSLLVGGAGDAMEVLGDRLHVTAGQDETVMARCE